MQYLHICMLAFFFFFLPRESFSFSFTPYLSFSVISIFRINPTLVMLFFYFAFLFASSLSVLSCSQVSSSSRGCRTWSSALVSCHGAAPLYLFFPEGGQLYFATPLSAYTSGALGQVGTGWHAHPPSWHGE